MSLHVVIPTERNVTYNNSVIVVVFAEDLAKLLVDARHAMDGVVQHRLQGSLGERAENLLRFA